MRLVRALPCLVLAVLLSGCDEQPVGPVPDETLPPLFGAVRQVIVTEVSIEQDPPLYNPCVGEEFQGHGTIYAIWRFTYPPSGSEILSLKTDYDTPTPFWHEGLSSGDRWDLTHGIDVGGWVAKDDGPPFMMHYQWHEKYANEAGERYQAHVKGHYMIDADGNVKMDRFDVSFVCN